MKKLVAVAVAWAGSAPTLARPGNPSRDERDFHTCAPCDSLEPDRNMTGPSLANVWGRKPTAWRGMSYLDALKASGIIWYDRSLDGWLTEPQL